MNKLSKMQEKLLRQTQTVVLQTKRDVTTRGRSRTVGSMSSTEPKDLVGLTKDGGLNTNGDSP